MGFSFSEELIDKLPGGGMGVDATDAEVYRIRWINSLEFDPETDREQALAEMIVEDGVTGELERLQHVRSGSIAPPEVAQRIQAARTLRKEYNALRTTASDAASEPVAYITRGWRP